LGSCGSEGFGIKGTTKGLTPEQIMDHYPQLTLDDIRAALAYAAELARDNVWKVAAGE
jgi:uncharacterized protein (DUF433 family)